MIPDKLTAFVKSIRLARLSWFRRMIQTRWIEPALDDSDESQPEPS